MIKTLKINNNLFVNVLKVDMPESNKESTSDVIEPSNQFLIFDRSGSMYGYLDAIVETAKEYCASLPEGSTVSLGYFSGTDQYNLSVPYVFKKELNSAVSVLETYRSALGMTNFYQILEKVNSVAKNIKTKSNIFMFTDGCHNAGNYSRIESALKEWSQYANVSMFVGYGYIDRTIMSRMAEITNGSFIHLNDFKNLKTYQNL